MRNVISDKQRYAAFLSYAHEDDVIAKRVQKSLETYSLPKNLKHHADRLSPIFRDVTELIASHSLSDRISDALENSRFLIVLCSPASKASHWVNEEIRLFRQLHGEDSILCALIEGSPATSFPPALTKDGREPLAADMTGLKESFKFGITQIAASLLNVGLDDLILRERQRQRRRVTLITASAISALLMMGALTWTAIDARQLAEQRRVDAEGQIEFMLTDLKDKLDEVGRLDALQAVGDRAAAYYDGYSLNDHDDDALGRRAKVYHLLGEIQSKLGNPQEADRYFLAAFEATKKLLEREPDNVDRVFGHAQSAFWVADGLLSSSKLNEAKPFYQAYHDLAQKIYELEGDTDRAQQELAYAYHNLGIVSLEEKSFVDALFFSKKASLYNQKLVQNNPSDIEKIISLTENYMAIGDIQMLSDEIFEALKSYTNSLQILSELQSHPNDKNFEINSEKQKIYRILARQHLLNNDPISSKIHTEKGIALSKDLIRIDAKNVDVLFEDVSLHFILFELAYLKNELELSKDLAKQINLKIAMFPDSLKGEYYHDVLIAVGLNTDLLMTSLSGNGDQVAARAKESLFNAGIDQFENLEKHLYYTDSIILADAISDTPQFKPLLAHMCNDPDLTLEFRRKVSLSTYIGRKHCPNATSLAPFPISSVQKFLTSMPKNTTHKN